MASHEHIQKTLILTTNEKHPPSPPSLSLSLTSEENLIDEDDLELSLAIPTPVTKTPLSFPQPLSEDDVFISKREVQALRRFEAKKKRDLKRKVSDGNGEAADVAREVVGGVSKVPRLNGSSWAPHSWLTWHNDNNNNNNNNNNIGGQSCNFGSQGKNVNVDESISSRSSSGVSDNDYQCFSGSGGNTSSAEDAISHSNQSQSQLTPPNNTQTPTNSPLQPQQKPSSSTSDNIRSKTHLSSSSNHSEQVTNLSQQSSKSPNSITSATQNPTANEAKGKPPRPNGQIKQKRPALAQMPCVSVTGNGPNGKTITGILYKYTKSEVSIVCVCHGASFSPAGFVEHAGGVDVEHPLRHIRVVPFAL